MANERILIVDDNAANLKLARVLLQTRGFDVRVAPDAEQALKVLDTWTPELILMDIQLPGMDGLELTRRLKADPETQGIKIVALTAYAMKGDDERARAAGCDDYISKPIDTKTLPTRVAELLERPIERRSPVPPLILVVDDNPTLQRLFRVSLETNGYHVISATTGVMAIEHVRLRPPDVILQDLLLPDMNGFDLTRRLRELPGGDHIPIIALTGFASMLEQTRALQAGFDAALVKPVEGSLLIETIERYLGAPVGTAHELGQSERILVVDDDPVQLKLTLLRLRRAGFRVTPAASGAIALELAKTAAPSLILSDVLMPGLDGFELCLEVQRDPRLSSIPVVLTSAHYRDEADDELARRAGAAAFVVRTPSFEGVIDAIHQALKSSPPKPAPEPLERLKKDHSQRVIQQLERQAAANATLIQQCALQGAQLSILSGVADALTRSENMESMLGDIISSCLDAGGISRGALYQIDARGKNVLRHAVGRSDEERERMATIAESSLFESIAAVGVAVSLPSPEIPATDQRALLAQLGVSSALIVPLFANRRVVGSLLLASGSPEVPDHLVVFGRTTGAYIGQAMALSEAFARVRQREEERAELLAREQEARQEAERASRAKDEFISILSHELRTPLTAIVGWASILSRGRSRRLDEVAEGRALDTILRNSKLLAQLIDDIFDVARISTGMLHLEKRAVELVPLVQAGVEAVTPAAQAKGVELAATIERGVGMIRGDPERVQQIVLNLLSNGVKFTPRAGRVEIRVEAREGAVTLQVKDTGQGIRADFLPFVFDRYRQGDSSVTRAHGGLGLGLSIVRHLVELHGGTVKAESAGEGRGSTFTVTLPGLVGADAATMANGGAPSSEPPPRLSSLRVLVVEDDGDTQELIASTLSSYGAQVTAVGSAEEALEALSQEAPDVLVSDLCMPGISGHELIRSIRRLPTTAGGRTPAIALTARTEQADAQAALAAGFQVHASKPIEPDALVTLVANLAGR